MSSERQWNHSKMISHATEKVSYHMDVSTLYSSVAFLFFPFLQLEKKSLIIIFEFAFLLAIIFGKVHIF